MFSVANGLILDPSGASFIARGINVNDWQMATAAPLLRQYFTGINAVRLACRNYASASTYTAFINAMSAAGIVVIIEDHTGISQPPLTGNTLLAELSWYAALAAAFGSNPYVWFGTFNEPGNGSDLAAITTQEVAIYNAIRATGSQAMILMELPSGGNPGLVGAAARGYDGAGPMTAPAYATMHNIVWDLHYYGWVSNYSTSPAAVAAALAGSVAGAAGILGAQSIQSADGLVPVIIGEFGNSTTGGAIDANGDQVIAAVAGSGKGFIAWAWDPDEQGDQAVTDAGVLTPYGRQIAAAIASAAASIGPGQWQPGVLSGGPTLPSGVTMRYALMVPSGVPAGSKLPVLVWLHENDQGNKSYPNGDPTQVALQDGPDAWFNNSQFLASFPCILVVPSCDQTTDSGGETENFGGWAPPGDHGPNEDSVALIVQHVLATQPADPTRVYVTGASLGGIGTWALMLDYNSLNGAFGRLFTAGLPMAGVIERYGFGVNPPASVLAQMINVPVFAVHGSGDTTSQPNWDRAFWSAFAGNTGYPKAPGARAGTSQFWYLEDPNLGHDVWDTYTPNGAGRALYAWLFSQQNGGSNTVAITPIAGFLQPGSTASVTAADGSKWTLTAAGVVDRNGSPVTGGSGTAQLGVVAGVIWAQDKASGGWYQYSTLAGATGWQPGTLPTGAGTGTGTGGGNSTPSPAAQAAIAQVAAAISTLQAVQTALQQL